uniref:Uncharacterized protein n=1 Tax=Anguilla anguilla TaxID=7936 RepID=A0A0E9TAU6_ANGAN
MINCKENYILSLTLRKRTTMVWSSNVISLHRSRVTC